MRHPSRLFRKQEAAPGKCPNAVYVADRGSQLTKKGAMEMAIPAKPTTRLVVDGVWGQKTRDALCYMVSADRVTDNLRSLSEMCGRHRKPPAKTQFAYSLQAFLNRTVLSVPVSGQASYDWKKIVYPPGDDHQWNTPRQYLTKVTGKPTLTVDGIYGPNSETIAGVFVAFNARLFPNPVPEQYQRVSRDVADVQTAINSWLF